MPPRVSDPDMHHGTWVTHVPWCMAESLNNGFFWSQLRGNVLDIPGACTTRNFTYLVRGPWLIRWYCRLIYSILVSFFSLPLFKPSDLYHLTCLLANRKTAFNERMRAALSLAHRLVTILYILTFQKPGGYFTNISRALQNILSKFVYRRNRASYENFKLKLCMCVQSHALGTHTKFRLEILTLNVISSIVNFREIILESSRNVSETTPSPVYIRDSDVIIVRDSNVIITVLAYVAWSVPSHYQN